MFIELHTPTGVWSLVNGPRTTRIGQITQFTGVHPAHIGRVYSPKLKVSPQLVKRLEEILDLGKEGKREGGKERGKENLHSQIGNKYIYVVDHACVGSYPPPSVVTKKSFNVYSTTKYTHTRTV